MEASSKKKGRPKTDENMMALIRRHHPNIRTDRGRQNVLFQMRAEYHLAPRKNPGFGWLFGVDTEGTITDEQFNESRWRGSVLEQIGRCFQKYDPDEVKQLALEICELQMPTRLSVAIINQWRLGKASIGSSDQLINRLMRTFTRFCNEYPDTPPDKMLKALRDFLMLASGDLTVNLC